MLDLERPAALGQRADHIEIAVHQDVALKTAGSPDPARRVQTEAAVAGGTHPDAAANGLAGYAGEAADTVYAGTVSAETDHAFAPSALAEHPDGTAAVHSCAGVAGAVHPGAIAGEPLRSDAADAEALHASSVADTGGGNQPDAT